MAIPTADEIIERVNVYSKSKDHELIKKAYAFSKNAHEGQLRESGEPFFKHPAKVALILTSFELDDASICAGLLHDVIEDTEYTYEDIKEEFGEEVANLVEGVTKLGKIPYNTKEEQQAENLRKMFMAMAMDIRVIFIKLSDRLHNMKTLGYTDKQKQIDKAKETLEIYAPLAHRLGMYSIKWELEDLCLRYIDPDAYYKLVDAISQRRNERERFINEIIANVKSKLKEVNIEADIEGRPKHFYSIYRKMKEQNKEIDQIFDLFALRVIVNSVKDCYAVLGLVHEMYRPLPGRFKDYIAMPKANGYQSLHTTLVGKTGHPFEIQIRTWDMHRTAEYGVAAHWKYKEKSTDKKDSFDEKISWIRRTVEWQKETTDSRDLMENLKFDLFSDDVFVFSPKGDVYQLPVHSTPIDFAYRVHSEVGNKMVGARVNDKMVPIGYELHNGDVVEIITSANSKGPSRDWLNIVKSANARAKMVQWFKKEGYEENVSTGKEAVERELKRLRFTHSDLFRPEWVEPMLKKYTFGKLEDCYAAIGYGALPVGKVIGRLKEEYEKERKAEEAKNKTFQEIPEEDRQKKIKKAPPSGIVVKGIDNCLVRLSKCCNPLPGDEIVGYITKGRGVSVHRSDCPNVTNFTDDINRLIDVEWYKAKNSEYVAEIEVFANDRNGLFADVSSAVNDAKGRINAINARVLQDRVAMFQVEVQLADIDHLNKVIKAIRKVDSVYEVRRKKN